MLLDSEAIKAQLPRYQCHKVVQAVKIGSLEVNPYAGSVMIVPADPKLLPFHTRADFDERYFGTAEDRGYFVLYEDGYESWSPSEVFENGYARIESPSK